jgi:hypothetical protein
MDVHWSSADNMDRASRETCRRGRASQRSRVSGGECPLDRHERALVSFVRPSLEQCRLGKGDPFLADILLAVRLGQEDAPMAQ